MSLTTTMDLIEDRFQLVEELKRGETLAFVDEGEPGSSLMAPFKLNEARVFVAKDLETGQTVAIKILDQASSKKAEFRTRFQRDAAILRSLDHPNAVKTIASGLTAEGQPYLVTEYLQGRTLEEIMANDGPLSPELMASYLKQVASALDAAHAQGIIHRDINPGAILILADSGEAKLLDFGLAKDLAKNAATQVELTSKQTSLGNAAYLSPEQARGGAIDGRSDVYALGVTLYQTLSGHLPFEGETDFQILLAQINGTIPPFPEGWTNHPGASNIEAVVLQALAKTPADRPATAGTLSDLFQEALQSRPSRKPGLSRPLVVAVGLAVAILSLILLAKWLL